MDCLIVGNGNITEEIERIIPRDCYVICADGGARHLDMLGISADIFVGDMDSLTIDISDKEKIIYPTKKDYTDSEIAVDLALKKGFKKIVMVGFTGTRLDHTLTNLFLLKRIKNNGAKGVIIDGHNEVYYLEDEIELVGKIGDVLSIIPIGKDILGINTEGLEYPLLNDTLEFAKGRGVSNVMVSEKCRISIKSGQGLVIKSKD